MPLSCEIGAGKEARTPDPNLGKVVLYQLSYSRNGIPKGIRTPVTAVKGRCPRPLDDGDTRTSKKVLVEPSGIEPLTSTLPVLRSPS